MTNFALLTRPGPISACSMPGGSGSGGHRHHSFGGPDRDEIIRTSGPSEIGIRTVSVVGYRSAGTAGSNSSGHHQVGLLSMLKQRFSTGGGGGGGGSRSSSKESDHSSTKVKVSLSLRKVQDDASSLKLQSLCISEANKVLGGRQGGN